MADIIICPYKSSNGNGCSHIYAPKEKYYSKERSICNCVNNPEDCQMFKNWEEEVDKAEEEEPKQQKVLNTP